MPREAEIALGLLSCTWTVARTAAMVVVSRALSVPRWHVAARRIEPMVRRVERVDAKGVTTPT